MRQMPGPSEPARTASLRSALEAGTGTPPRRRRRRRAQTVGTLLVVALALATVGYLLVPRLLRHHVSISRPGSIDGLPLLSGSQRQADQLVAGLQSNGADNAVAGVYGTDQSDPQVVLALGTGDNPGSRDGAFAGADYGGLTVDSASTTQVRSGITYGCRRFTSGGTTVAIGCAWTDGDSAGLVVDRRDTDFGSAAELADRARHAATG